MSRIKKQSFLIILLIIVVFSMGFLVARNTMATGNSEIYTRDELSEIIKGQKSKISNSETIIDNIPIGMVAYINNERVNSLDSEKDYILESFDCQGDNTVAWNNETKQLSVSSISNNCSLYFLETNTFNYVRGTNYQEFVASQTGNYRIELWGSASQQLVSNVHYARGSYTSGEIVLNQNEVLYLYIGSRGDRYKGGYNGGGNSGNFTSCASSNNCVCTYNQINGHGGGGGATDVRLNIGTWNSFDSLKSRIMVAAGAGSSQNPGGGLNGYDYQEAGYPTWKPNYGTQTYGGASPVQYQNAAIATPGVFGQGGHGSASIVQGYGGGGGSGYYGGSGGTGATCGAWSGGSGSSFISGHAGCNAISSSSTSSNIIHTSQPNHYSNKIFHNTIMIDGKGIKWEIINGQLIKTSQPMPDPHGGYFADGLGNPLDGYARITYLGN